MTRTSLPAPHVLIVGGLGGSGTRAVAQALGNLGYAHGPALNESEDCLAFTYLFVRTDWLSEPLPSLQQRLEVLRRWIETGHSPLAPDLDTLTSAIRRRTPPAGAGPFLIKEPNTHIFADDILNAWSDCTFMFVHRHPLDMAFSKNINQLKRWGPALGIEPSAYEHTESAQLALWIKSRKDQAQRMLDFPGRTSELDYDAFTQSPAQTLQASLSELGIEVEAGAMNDACRHVHRPDSQGRSTRSDLSHLSTDLIETCRREGWL